MTSADVPSTIYRWIEKKPLTEAVSWTSREKFWMFVAVCHYGTHDWKSVAQVVRNAGEQYRPKDWYAPKNVERQFKVIVSNQSKEVKSLPLDEMVEHIAESYRSDYERDITKSKDLLKTKYCGLFSILNRMKQGNLSRNEVVSLYSQARRNENDGKQYVEQLMTRQDASLASENSSSGLSEETIKWNTPSAPLLTSLLRSRNTIPANRTVTTIASLLQSPGGTSRTRSGKMLPLSSSVRTTSAQGTPTLSKLLEAPANPYLSSPPQTAQKNKQNEVFGTDKVVVGNTSRKENSLPTLNKVQVDNVNNSGSFNQINKSDLSASKKQPPKSPVSAVKNGSKVTSNIISLISDSDNDEDSKSPVPNTYLKEKKDTSTVSRIEPRATRSQTRAEGSFKQLNDTKMYDEKKEEEILQQESGVSQLSDTDDEIIDIDQIDVEPLSSVQDEITTRSKVTRSFAQRSLVKYNTTTELLNKVKSKEISNQMLEEISANFVLNSTIKNVATEYKNVMVGRSRIDSANLSRCIVPIGGSTVKDAIILRKDVCQSFPTPVNMLTTFDGKILKHNRLIDFKGKNLKCIDGKVFTNPVVVLKKPFNIKLAPELKNKIDDLQLKNNDQKKAIKINNSSQNLVQLLDSHHSFSNDNISLEDDVIINVEDGTTTKTKKLSSKVAGLQNLALTVVSSKDCPNTSGISKSTSVQLNEKKTKTFFNVFGKPQTLLNIPSKTSSNQDSVSKIEINSNIPESNNHYIKELDFDFDQSISQNSLSNLYHGVEEIVDMNPFDNEELNSLIQCTSLDNSETEEPQNVIDLDRSDSLTSEGDVTIGAYDTFAQITRLPTKPPKDLYDVKKEIIDDDQNYGIPIESVPAIYSQPSSSYDYLSEPIPLSGLPSLKNVVLGVINSTKRRLPSPPPPMPLNAADSIDIDSSSDEDNSSVHEAIVLSDHENDDEKTKQMRRQVFSVQQHIARKNGMRGIINLEVRSSSPPPSVTLDSRSTAVKNLKAAYTRGTCEKNIIVNRNQLDMFTASTSKESDKVKKENEVKELINTKKDLELVKNQKMADVKETVLRISNANRGTLKIVQESKEKLQIEALGRNKKEQVKKGKDIEVKKDEEKEFETEITKKAKEIDKNEFEAEITQRAKKPQIKSSKIPEMSKLKEAEMIKTKEIEMEKAKEIQIKRSKELEMRRLELLEQRKAKENEMKKAKEIEMKKAKELEMKKAKELAILKEIEMKKAKEIEMMEIEERKAAAKKAQEIELQKAKEARIQRIKDAEILQAKKAETLRKVKEAELLKEVEIKKAEAEKSMKAKEMLKIARVKDEAIIFKNDEEFKRNLENEKRLAKEGDLKNKKEEDITKDELKKAKTTEIKNVLDEAKIRKTKEAELKETKNIEMKEKEEKLSRTKGAELKKIKELEAKDTQLIKIKEIELNMKVVEVHVQLQRQELSDQSKKVNNSERLTNETKKINVKETGIKKEFDKEVSKSKEQGLKKSDEVRKLKDVENKINTRTRGLKTEGKLKDVSKNMSVKSVSSLKPLGPSPSSLSSTSEPTKNMCDGNKRNDNINKCDKDLNSSEFIKHEISGKSRTRSSLSKQSTNSEKLSTSVVLGGNDILQTSNVEVKTKPLISSRHDVPSSSINQQHRTELSKDLNQINIDKDILISFKHLPDIFPLKDPVIYLCKYDGTTQGTADNDKKLEKPPPKKRGRKRRVDVEMSNRDKPNLQNGATINTQDTEPLAKRTRRSIEIPLLTKRTRKTVDARESKKETVVESHEKTCTKKTLLKYFYKCLHDSRKRLQSFEKIVKNSHPDDKEVIKNPIHLQDIKRQINAGEILSISDLELNFMKLAVDAVMVLSTKNKKYDAVADFLFYANDEFEELRKDFCDDYADLHEKSDDLSGINVSDVIINDGNNKNSGGCNNAGPSHHERMKETKTYNRFTRSNKESSSDSESDKTLPYKKRRITYNYKNEDTDDYYDEDTY